MSWLWEIIQLLTRSFVGEETQEQEVKSLRRKLSWFK